MPVLLLSQKVTLYKDTCLSYRVSEYRYIPFHIIKFGNLGLNIIFSGRTKSCFNKKEHSALSFRETLPSLYFLIRKKPEMAINHGLSYPCLSKALCWNYLQQYFRAGRRILHVLD